MRWKSGRRSSNVEDRRGQSAGVGGGPGSGLLGFIPMLVRSKTGRIILVISVAPDSFTHGTSEQRVKWFRKGFESGDIAVCNTLN